MRDGRRRYTDLPRSDARIDRDVNDEIQFDIDMRVRELVNGGMPEHAARELATREFGDIDATRRYCAAVDAHSERDARRSQWFDDVRQDCVLALRAMRASPAFATVVLLTLGIGLGANTAIYSVVRRMLVDRLPYRDAGALVRIAYPNTGTSAYSGFVTPAQLRDLATLPSLDGVAAFGNLGSIMYYDEQSVEAIPVASVTPNFFGVLGASALHGRTFGVADVDAGPVVVVGYDFWQHQLHGDSAVVGRTIRLSGGVRTIIGIMPNGFVSPQFNAGLWLPLNVQRMLGTPRAANSAAFRGIARLRAGATIERADADAAIVATRWRADGAIRAATPAPRFLSLRDAMVGQVRPALLAVMSAALLVLAIACTNIAGLFLARATRRRREMAVRAALGAGRARLVRQLLTESVLYGVGGGVLGVAIAMIMHPVIVRLATDALPALGEIRIDFALTATSFAVALTCGVVVGVMPAVAGTRVNLRQSMGEGGRGASTGGERMRVRQLLVASQITLAILLMVGAGLLFRSFARVVNTPLGYSTGNDVLVFTVTAPDSLAANQEARAAFFGDILRRAHALPGVVNVALTSIGPWNGPNSTTLKSISSGRVESRATDAKFLTATEEYFSAIGTRVIRGRPFAATDRPGSTPVVLLSESAARALFGSADPIGQRVIVDTAATIPDPGHEVIGIVEDYRENAAAERDASIYVSDWQDSKPHWAQFIVRTNGDASRLVPSLRALMREMTPESPLMFPRTMRDLLHQFLAPQQLSLSLFGVFATLALALAALGVYGVMSYVVASRTREFGIRTALGARRGVILALVLEQGMRAALAGVIAGLVLALAAARVMSKLLIGVSARDPLTFIVAPALLLTIALIACTIPARRATRIDPLEALRGE